MTTLELVYTDRKDRVEVLIQMIQERKKERRKEKRKKKEKTRKIRREERKRKRSHTMGWKPHLKAVCLVHLDQGKYDRHRCILNLIEHICVLAFKSWRRGQEAQPSDPGQRTHYLETRQLQLCFTHLIGPGPCASEITPPGRWPPCGTVDLVRSEFIIRDVLGTPDHQLTTLPWRNSKLP